MRAKQYTPPPPPLFSTLGSTCGDIALLTSAWVLPPRKLSGRDKGRAPGCRSEPAPSHSSVSSSSCVFLSTSPQKAEASDEENEEKTALMSKPGSSSTKEDKENEAFFKKVIIQVFDLGSSKWFVVLSDTRCPGKCSSNGPLLHVYETEDRAEGLAVTHTQLFCRH